MTYTAIALAVLCAAAPAASPPAAPAAPPPGPAAPAPAAPRGNPTTVQALVAGLPDPAAAADPAEWERRLAAAEAAVHRILVAPRTAYDPVKRTFRVRLPDEVERADRPEDPAAGGPGARRVVASTRLAPVNADDAVVLEIPATPAEAPGLADAVELAVTLRLAAGPAGADGRRASPLQVSRSAHARTNQERWDGTLEVRALSVHLLRLELVRRKDGRVMASHAAGQAAAEPPPGSVTEPVRTRKSLDRYGRAGSQWTMKDQHTYMEGCRTWQRSDPDQLGVTRRCRCMLEATQLRYPAKPPPDEAFEKDADIRGLCAPAPDAPAPAGTVR